VRLLPTHDEDAGVRQRNHLINELYSTELVYLRGLRHLRDAYLSDAGMREAWPVSVRAELLDARLLETLLELHELFAGTMRAQINFVYSSDVHTPSMGACLSVLYGMPSYAHTYKAYCASYATWEADMKAARAEHKALREYLDEPGRKGACDNLDFGALLIKPVQRVLKYPLLIRQLLETIDPTHIEHADIQAALRRAEDTADIINEHKRSVDTVAALRDLLGRVAGLPALNMTRFDVTACGEARIYLMHDALAEVSNEAGVTKTLRGARPVFYALFSDMLLRAAQTPAAAVAAGRLRREHVHPYALAHVVPLHALRGRELPDLAAMKNGAELSWSDADGVETTWYVLFPTQAKRKAWLVALQRHGDAARARAPTERLPFFDRTKLHEPTVSVPDAPPPPSSPTKAPKLLRRISSGASKRSWRHTLSGSPAPLPAAAPPPPQDEAGARDADAAAAAPARAAVHDELMAALALRRARGANE
jgi:hypothetical protein